MKTVANILGIIGCTFLILIGTILFAGGIAEPIVSMWIVGLLFFAGGLFGVIALSKKTRQNPHYQERAMRNKERSLKNKERMYRNKKYKLTFVAGLPLMQGAMCKVLSTDDKIIINGQGTTFELKKEKITSITIETNTTKQTQAISSAGGALAGAMAFGVVGVAIGGRAKAKDIKVSRSYIVITYFDSKDNVKYIIFDYKLQGTSLVKEFQTFNQSGAKQRTVEID